MKQSSNFFRNAVCSIITAFMLSGVVQAQLTAEPWAISAPFDFSDRYYAINGVEPDGLIDRRDGFDRKSVIDFAYERNRRGVRITETFSGTNSEGNLIFWNHYADLTGRSFQLSDDGGEAAAIANRYPIYMFPSSSIPGQFRQSAILTTDEDYFDKNPLGLALVFLIDYTDLARSKKGQRQLLERLGDRQKSADGDPVIFSVSEINSLIRLGLISQRIRGTGRAETGSSHIVAKQIEDPRFGAIAADAYLVSTSGGNGLPIDEEQRAIAQFKCLQLTGNYCGQQ